MRHLLIRGSVIYFLASPQVTLLETIGRLLNYTYSVYNPVDQLWGRIEDNGRWSGMIHEAAVGNAEMAISAIIFRHSRSQVAVSSEQRVVKRPPSACGQAQTMIPP
jgi:hypothetical protein